MPRCPFRAKYQWLGWVRFGATECRSSSFLFPPPVVPRCFNTYSFFSCFTSFHVEIPRARAGPNDGRARAASFDLVLCLRSALSTPRHLLHPCHASFPIPFEIINICANLASTSRDSLQSSILMPNILSQSMLSPAKNAFPSLPVSFYISVLFLHTISLIHRLLALYHSRVAISEFESFESSLTSKIRLGICPSILSPL
jgi:hypothetical protein